MKTLVVQPVVEFVVMNLDRVQFTDKGPNVAYCKMSAQEIKAHAADDAARAAGPGTWLVFGPDGSEVYSVSEAQ